MWVPWMPLSVTISLKTCDAIYSNGIWFYLDSTEQLIYFFMYVKSTFDELHCKRGKIRRSRSLVFSITNRNIPPQLHFLLVSLLIWNVLLRNDMHEKQWAMFQCFTTCCQIVSQTCWEFRGAMSDQCSNFVLRKIVMLLLLLVCPSQWGLFVLNLYICIRSMGSVYS